MSEQPAPAGGHWLRSTFMARPALTCIVAGAVLGVAVIHTTAAFAMSPGAYREVGPTFAAAFSLASVPLLIYHALMGIIVGCAAGLLVSTAFRGEIAERERAKALESQLHRSQKMESVGRLASGVAHDFNNILTAVGMSVFLARSAAQSGQDPSRFLDEAEKAVQRGAQLPRQLLAFARRQPSAPKVVDAAVVVRDLEKMLRRLIGEEIVLETRLAAGNVRIDPGQLEQVLVNLTVNARDAMPLGGRIAIETRVVDYDADTIPDPDLKPGRHLVASVIDTGTGIPPELRDRIFEPFFTTKPDGKGTGLGLATVYGIVRQNAGAITLESRVGDGTTFRVHLPIVDEAAAPRSETERAMPRAGSATVLIVDDQPEIREAVAGAVRALGYDVAEAGSAAEAIDRVATLHDPRSRLLVLADIVMPGMQGPELAHVIRAAFPTVPVILMTGQQDERRAEHLEGETVLEKPFTPSTLAQTIATALGAPLAAPER